MTDQSKKGNTGLYFILGVLVLAVAVMGYYYMDDTAEMGDIEPAAGIERPNNPADIGSSDDNTANMDDTTRQYNNDME